MKTTDNKFAKEIELERLWSVTKHGKSIFFIMLPFSLLIVFGLWEKVQHVQLITWFFLFNILNSIKWSVLNFYHFHKEKLANNVKKFQLITFILGIFTGLTWTLCVVLFLDPADPANVLTICLPSILQVIGSITWFASLYTVVAMSITPSIALMVMFSSASGTGYIITAIFVSVLPLLTYSYSRNLLDMVNNSLRLSFENAALRRDFEEKTILLETVLDNMSQGISMSDKEDRLCMWNNKFIELLGEAGSLVSFNANLIEILDATNPSTPPFSPLADNIYQVNPGANHTTLQGKTKLWSQYRLTSGQIYEIRQSELSQGGRVLTYTDITEQVKHQEALERARREAEQANAAKTRFLATASHDLRQPIHALGLFFAELAERIRSPQTERLIGQVEDAIDAINSMLNALLDISKLDAGIVKPNVELVSLVELFSRMQAEFRPIASENANQLIIRPVSAVIQTDPAMLERILRNLIGNALRYTQNGKVLVAARLRGENLKIQIWDTGPGIPEDQLDNIFVEFHQLHNPARDRRQGLGLGLAIVKRLAHLLRHDIKVVSKLGHGSCFSITLPLASKSMATEIKPYNTVTHSLSNALMGCHLLILDDDIAVREGMKGLLMQWGCQVITVGSSTEAKIKLKEDKSKLDLIIVDYRLPESQSGIEIARSLQAGLAYPVGVLIITGDTSPERLQESEASGFPLLHKPVQPAKLRSTLQFLLNKNKLKIN